MPAEASSRPSSGAGRERWERRRGERLGGELGRGAARGVPAGVYLHGGVGTGKTYVMDLFYDTLPDGMPKRRVHFNKFMLDVHTRLHKLRTTSSGGGTTHPEQEGLGGGNDPLEVVTRQLLAEGGCSASTSSRSRTSRTRSS